MSLNILLRGIGWLVNQIIFGFTVKTSQLFMNFVKIPQGIITSGIKRMIILLQVS